MQRNPRKLMSMIYFTSDLHFHHNKIMQYSPAFRNYADSNKMQEALIETWNNTVTKDDLVYDLGDFSMASSLTRLINTAKRLNGKHVLVLGNHDYIIRKNRDRLLGKFKDDGNKLFEAIEDYIFINITSEDKEFALLHYPIFGWERQQHGSIMLHGHLHDYIPIIKGKILNVGFDLHGKLLSLKEVIKLTENLPTLPYRDENSEVAKIIKATTDLKERRKMIISELKRINEL